VDPSRKLSFLPFLITNQMVERRIFLHLSLLSLSFLPVSLKPNKVLELQKNNGVKIREERERKKKNILKIMFIQLYLYYV
jgi:uncharacterized secreted protein with C-terminal beta-propeller domain